MVCDGSAVVDQLEILPAKIGSSREYSG